MCVRDFTCAPLQSAVEPLFGRYDATTGQLLVLGQPPLVTAARQHVPAIRVHHPAACHQVSVSERYRRMAVYIVVYTIQSYTRARLASP